MNRKNLTLVLAMLLLLSGVLGACSPNTSENDVANEPASEPAGEEEISLEEPAKIFALKGPTAMGLAEFFQKIDDGEEKNYTYTIGNSPDEAVAALGGGNADILMVPANLAAAIYNKNQNIKIAGINTLGVLYLASTGEELNSLEELKGKTVTLAGKGATPEFGFKALLKKAGLSEDDVTLDFKTEHAEVVQTLVQDPEAIGLIPQPFLTVAMTKNKDIKQVFDLNECWKKTFNDNGMVTGVAVVTKEFAEAHPRVVDDFLDKYGKSVDFVNDNVEEAAALIGSYDIVPEPVAKQAIPHCNIVLIRGDEMEKSLNSYYEALFSVEPKATGGSVPDGEIYYK